MDGASLLDESKRVEKVGDLVRVLARKPNRFMTLDRGWIIRLAVEDRPTLLVRPDVEADEAHAYSTSPAATAFAKSMMRRRTFGSLIAVNALTSSRPSEVARKSVKERD